MDSLLRWEGQGLVLTAAVLLARLLLRRRPRRLVMPLWWVCLLRLLCPCSLPVLPAPPSGPGALAVFAGAAAVQQGAAAPGTVPGLTALWMAGAALLLLRLAFRRWRLGRILRFAVREEEDVWCCDGLPGPFAAGVLRGRVYLPFRLPEEVRRQALRHERTHLRRRDPLLLLGAELACALHWWDPLVWLAARAIREDVELACDEVVLCRADGAERRAYFEAMLHFAAGPAGPSFGGTQAERRVRHAALLRPLSRPAARGIGAVLVLCALPCFLTALPAARLEVPGFSSGTAFAQAVCAAAGQDDAQALAALVRYPLTLRRDGTLLRLEGPADFLRAYSQIFGPETRADLLAADPEDLFQNWAGVMIGQGSVWFEGSAETGFYMTAINEMK